MADPSISFYGMFDMRRSTYLIVQAVVFLVVGFVLALCLFMMRVEHMAVAGKWGAIVSGVILFLEVIETAVMLLKYKRAEQAEDEG